MSPNEHLLLCIDHILMAIYSIAERNPNHEAMQLAGEAMKHRVAYAKLTVGETCYTTS